MKTCLLVLSLFYLPVTGLACNCFQFLLEKGNETFKNRQFSTALQKYTAARDCPDRPASGDLEERIQRTQQCLDEQKMWNRARNADTPESYQRYLDRYKNGYYRRRADDALAKLKSLSTQPVQEKLSTGSINWTQEFVEAIGQSVINRERFTNEAQAIAMATRGAETVAKANLLETAGGVHLMRNTTVKDMMTESDVVYSSVQGVIKSTRMVGEPSIANGMVTVTLRMPVTGANSISTAALGSEKLAMPALLEEIPDSVGEQFLFRLRTPSVNLAMYPTVLDESGNILLDGMVCSRQLCGESIVRYIRPETVPAGMAAVEVSEDENGRWVIPASAVPGFQQWLQLRHSGAGVGPILVLI